MRDTVQEVTLAGGSSDRRTQRRTLDPQQRQLAVDLRHQRCTLRRIAKAEGAPLSTVGRVLKALGSGGCGTWNPSRVHVAVDDATRLAYVEVLPDEQKATTVGFLARAVGWFNAQGITCRRILIGNGSAYRSGEWRKACQALDLQPIRTKPYTPRTNGKAERFIQTLCREWAYGMPFQTSDERNCWPPRNLMLYNKHRCHMALAGLTPQQRLAALLAE